MLRLIIIFSFFLSCEEEKKPINIDKSVNYNQAELVIQDADSLLYNIQDKILQGFNKSMMTQDNKDLLTIENGLLEIYKKNELNICLLYTSPSPRDS